MNKNTFFVTGTDTEVGKTLVTAALMSACSGEVLGIKPVAAGAGYETLEGETVLQNDDAKTLLKYCRPPLKYNEVNPYCFKEAIAPHIAAKINNKLVTVSTIVDHCRKISSANRATIFIEGAGGWRVPLNDNEYLSDLPKQLNIPVILVVGLRLGCINHTLLTYEAIENDGLTLAGWVANCLSSNMDEENQNIETLKEKLSSIAFLGKIPYLSNPTAEEASSYLKPEKIINSLE